MYREHLVPAPSLGRTPEEWLAVSQAPHLQDCVPQDVRDYFAIARGTMAYGAFSLPCLHFGGDQILRSAECAIKCRSRQAGVVDAEMPFDTRLGFLFEAKLLTEDQHARWSAARKLRNTVAHRVRLHHESHEVYLARTVEIAGLINELFSAEPNSSSEPTHLERTPQNWLALDRNFAWLAGSGWKDRLARPQLSTAVPDEIRSVFEQIRVGLEFGQFYYALCSLVGEMSHHLAVLAIEHRLAMRIGSRKARHTPVREQIAQLLGAGLLDAARAAQLEPVLGLRNGASHPDFHTIVPPTYHFQCFKLLADDLNALFR